MALFNAEVKFMTVHKILVNITLNDIAIFLIQFVTILLRNQKLFGAT